MEKKILFAGLFLVLPTLFCNPEVQAGELVVGKKVVYPGGADQPPKEKDVGVKLKVESRGGTVFTQDPREEDAVEEKDFEALLQDGKTREILDTTAGKTDPASKGYRALALEKVDRRNEARSTAQEALKSDDLPDDLRERLEKIVNTELSGKDSNESGE